MVCCRAPNCRPQTRASDQENVSKKRSMSRYDAHDRKGRKREAGNLFSEKKEETTNETRNKHQEVSNLKAFLNITARHHPLPH